MKKILSRKKVFSLFALTLTFVLLVLPFITRPGSDDAKIDNRYSYKGILTLYSLDSFEGGVNSCSDFLNRAAVAFEKQNRGVFVQVVPVSAYELEDRLSRGLVPDILLYSYGGRDLLEDKFEPYTMGVSYSDTFAQTDDAVPIFCGGYFRFSSNAEYPYAVGEADYNNPYLACILSDYTAVPEHGMTQKAAYEKSIFKKFNLIGTQRDVFRLQNSDRELERAVFSDFTDLVQYGSVVNISDERCYFSQKFLEYLTSPVIQNKLNEIGMCSVTGAKLYDGVLGEFEDRIEKLIVPRLDRSREEILNERQDAAAALSDPELRDQFIKKYR